MDSIKTNKYVDEVYNFKGRLEIPSVCGIRICKKEDKTLIIATELYDKNPGSSVTEWSDKLTLSVCKDYNIDPEKVIFIEHTPDKKSKLNFNNETFFQVDFKFDGNKFVDPDWTELNREDVDKLIEEFN